MRRITGFHRIRYYGLFSNTARKDNLARARELLMSENPEDPTDAVVNGAETADSDERDEPDHSIYVCPDCGAPMLIIDIFARGQLPRAPPMSSGRS